MKKLITAVLLASTVVLAACSPEADIASSNVSRAADQFEVSRTIHFYDSIQGRDILVVTGRCSIGNDRTTAEVAITCKTGPSTYLKHFLGLSDNVTYFAEQVEPVAADPYRYRVIFNPISLIPDIDLVTP